MESSALPAPRGRAFGAELFTVPSGAHPGGALDSFDYEIVAAPSGQASRQRLERLIREDAELPLHASPWSLPTKPMQSNLYALLVIVTDDLASDRVAKEKVAYASGCGLPVIGVVEDLGKYDFSKAPLAEIAERNAEWFSNPQCLRETLLHHAGIRFFGSGGRVFISYARKDGSALAEAVRAALRAAGIGHDIDVHEFPDGEVIQDEIAERIRGADLVALIDSVGAAKSKWVAEELDIASPRMCR